MAQINNIKKFKPCKNISLERIAEEISTIEKMLPSPIFVSESSYRIHKVEFNGDICLAADAKLLNKYTNQKRRGNLRYLFDMNAEYLGLALENDLGKYRKVA